LGTVRNLIFSPPLARSKERVILVWQWGIMGIRFRLYLLGMDDYPCPATHCNFRPDPHSKMGNNRPRE